MNEADGALTPPFSPYLSPYSHAASFPLTTKQLCNLAFAGVSLAVLVSRHRKLAIRQYSRLAARIGVVTV